MRIDILTLFPDMFASPLSLSIVKRAQQRGLVQIALSNIRDFAKDSYKKVDDKPYGGGPGQILRIEPVYKLLKKIRSTKHETRNKFEIRNSKSKIVLLSARGQKWTQKMAQKFSKLDKIIFICPRYEGHDERIRKLADACLPVGMAEISIGDYVLTGGELAAAVITDCIVRLIPGSISDEQSALSDSFQDNLLAPPVYTRPAEYKGWKVPDILLSGNFKEIEKWQMEQSIERTKLLRPDLLKND